MPSSDRTLRDGRDLGLKPLESLDVSRISSFRDLLHAMSRTAFSGRQLGEAFEILVDVARDADCTRVLTISGAMTVAKQGRLVCDLIERGLVQAMVATGALIAHGLSETIGLTHYAHDPNVPDRELFDHGFNRVYDTLEMEANLNDVERLVREVLHANAPPGGSWWSAEFCRAVGKKLSERAEGIGILRTAYEKGVPVFIPAFTDSEMGLDVATWALSKALAGEPLDDPQAVFREVPPYNPFLDLQEFARLIGRAKKLAILTIGGGVPRNWAQQVGPYYDITNHRLGTKLRVPRYQYGVRICPEPVHWGGLSGCTYSEGVSWGKFVSPADGGRFAEVYADATVVFPILLKGLFEELDAVSRG